MAWFKIDFNDVFFNGLTSAEVGCVVKYKCACQQFDVDTLDEKRLKSIFTSRELKFVQKYFGLCSKNDESSSEVCQEFVQSLSEVGSKFVQSSSKVCSKKSSKNKDLPNIYNNNIYNTLQEREKDNIPPKNIFSNENNILSPQGDTQPKKVFKKPTLEEVKAYCLERKNNVDAERWLDYYTSNGWKVGKNPMKDWRAAVRTWERGSLASGGSKAQTDEEFYRKLEAL